MRRVREDLTERRQIVDMPMHIIADQSINDSTHSHVLVGARPGRVFFRTIRLEQSLEKPWCLIAP